MSPGSPSPREFTGRHMAIVVVAFFGVIIAVNIALAIAATGTWTGLVVKNSYVESNRFNDRLEEVRAQEALGWSDRTTYEDGTLAFHVTDAGGHAMAVDQVVAKVGRPTEDRDDMTVALAPMRDGGFAGAVTLAPGVWDVWITAARANGAPYRAYWRTTVRLAP